MLSGLDRLRDYSYYFQFTLTGYGTDVKINVPSKKEVVIPAFRTLSERIGAEKVIWRYDPILFTDQYTPAYHVKAFTQMDFINAFKNSLLVTVSATVLVTLFAAMLAYYIVRHNNGISKLTFALMVASMIIPFQAIMIPLVSIYGGTLNILNHRLTLIFMHTGFSMAMSVFMFHGFIKGNVPMALEEAAYIDGCTHSQTFFKIVLPLLKPIISTMVILNSLAFWNDFLLPSLVLTDKKLLTLPLSTYSFYGTYSADYGTIMAGLLLCVVPILILYVVLQKQIIGGVVAGAVK